MATSRYHFASGLWETYIVVVLLQDVAKAHLVSGFLGRMLYGERADSGFEATLEFHSKLAEVDPANAKANH